MQTHPPSRRRPIHYDLSDYANWRTACPRGRPNAEGSNLSLDEAQVTCPACLLALGYAPAQIEAREAILDLTVEQLTGGTFRVAA